MDDPAPGAHPGHRILVIDDNRAVREALVTLLEARGFGARGVSNGREALETLRAGFEACLILLDLTMPIMDGWKFRELQRQDPRLAEIPVVVLATLSDATTAARTSGSWPSTMPRSSPGRAAWLWSMSTRRPCCGG